MNEAYVGTELDIFAHALCWKAYFSTFFLPCGPRVLEVGAGLGATTAVLCDGSQEEWICLEPDGEMRAGIDQRILSGELPKCCLTHPGTVLNLDGGALFNAILYIDVLEHIVDDRAELEVAARHLQPGGRLVVLSPALPFLYSPFDASIGHYRRYTKASLGRLSPSGCRLLKGLYLDSAGLFTSLANRLILRQALPTLAQILFWDRRIVPFSRFLDRLTGYHIGRSILFIWQRLKDGKDVKIEV